VHAGYRGGVGSLWREIALHHAAVGTPDGADAQLHGDLAAMLALVVAKPFDPAALKVAISQALFIARAS
jgi:hypothetical protein